MGNMVRATIGRRAWALFIWCSILLRTNTGFDAMMQTLPRSWDRCFTLNFEELGRDVGRGLLHEIGREAVHVRLPQETRQCCLRCARRDTTRCTSSGLALDLDSQNVTHMLTQHCILQVQCVIANLEENVTACSEWIMC